MLNAFAVMLPELEAQEAIRATQIIGVGSGAMTRDDRRKLLQDWNHQAGAVRRLKSGKPGSQEFEGTMAGAGIKVVTVPARSKGRPENSSE